MDDKGRLKLPVGFQKYFGDLPEKQLFVTSLNARTARIYTLSAWLANDEFLRNYAANPRAARNVAFTAADLGAESEMDAQGRVLFPPELRRELKIEGQTVRLFALRDCIEVLSEAEYYERKRRAAETAEQDVDELERAGLK